MIKICAFDHKPLISVAKGSNHKNLANIRDEPKTYCDIVIKAHMSRIYSVRAQKGLS